MYILIDNYDSFSYNVYHLLAKYTPDEVRVIRNDAFSVEEIKKLNPKAIIISPGPGYPMAAGICMELITSVKKHIPIMGICLGMQAIAEVFGAKIIRCPLPMHGKVSAISHHGTKLLKNIPSPVNVTRYHSLCIDPKSLPTELIASAFSDDNVIQAIYHQTDPIWGVQFHPESIRTEYGHVMIKNFLNLVEEFYQ